MRERFKGLVLGIEGGGAIGESFKEREKDENEKEIG